VTQPERSSSSPGLFIALEGGDGAGKSTQGRLLRAWLEGLGYTVVVTREPGGTTFGRTVRELVLHGDHVAPRAEALLFAADRAHHVDTLIRPALGRGEVVITDRYMDSSIAYQGAGRDLGVEEVRALNAWATGGLVPALTVLVDLAAEIGRARRGGVHDRLESEADAFHRAVREHFLALAGAAPDRYLVVDGEVSAEQIHVQVRARVAMLLSAPQADVALTAGAVPEAGMAGAVPEAGMTDAVPEAGMADAAETTDATDAAETDATDAAETSLTAHPIPDASR